MKLIVFPSASINFIKWTTKLNKTKQKKNEKKIDVKDE
jgi:hypothetical protein